MSEIVSKTTGENSAAKAWQMGAEQDSMPDTLKEVVNKAAQDGQSLYDIIAGRVGIKSDNERNDFSFQLRHEFYQWLGDYFYGDKRPHYEIRDLDMPPAPMAEEWDKLKETQKASKAYLSTASELGQTAGTAGNAELLVSQFLLKRFTDETNDSRYRNLYGAKDFANSYKYSNPTQPIGISSVQLQARNLYLHAGRLLNEADQIYADVRDEQRVRNRRAIVAGKPAEFVEVVGGKRNVI
ncbi:MAG: hypothetical protein LBM73_03020 [Candidatus Nomurabacteria bacterium]|jgi:hypothetical protein|nr:hypothetical protein [Candidatus Nomurabacteria bacterium]